MTGFLASLALHFPQTAEFLKRYWKFIGGAIVAVTLVVSFLIWKDNLEDAAEKRGFDRAEQLYIAAVNEANAREAETQRRLDRITERYNGVVALREQEVTNSVQPIIQRITEYVETDPDFASSTIPDSVLRDLNAGSAAINRSITASTPSEVGR